MPKQEYGRMDRLQQFLDHDLPSKNERDSRQFLNLQPVPNANLPTQHSEEYLMSPSDTTTIMMKYTEPTLQQAHFTRLNQQFYTRELP